MKKIISCLLLTALLMTSLFATVNTSAAEVQETNVMLSVGTKDSAANNQFAGEGNVFYYDYLKYVKEVNTFPLSDSYKGHDDYMIRYDNNGSGSASATDGTKTTSNFTHSFTSAADEIPYIPNDTYDQVFGYSFKNSVMVDGIKIYLPTTSPITDIDVYGASADVENDVFAYESEKILLQSFTNVNSTPAQTVTEADGTTSASVIVIEAAELNEALKIDYIIFGVKATDAYKVYEIELNGLSDGYADFTALKAQIAAYKEIAPYYSTYTSESWTALEAAFTQANAINKNASSTQDEINSAASAIETAIGNLKIDKSALSNAIAEAQTKVEADYTPTTWEPFKNILDTAITAMSNDTIAPDAIAEIAQSLIDATNYLEPRANFDEIDSKLAEVEALNKDDYSEASWNSLQTVIAKIPTAKANTNLTQEEANALLGELTTAINALKPPADLATLEAKLAEVAELKEEDYVPASWDAFQAIVAKAVAVKNGSGTTQADVDKAIQDLDDGMKNVLQKHANKTELTKAVADAKKLKKENYDISDLTWNVFIKSIEDAEAAINNVDATQGEVNTALETLKTSIKNLGKVYEYDPSSNSNKNPTDGDKNDDNTNDNTNNKDNSDNEDNANNEVNETNSNTQAPIAQAPSTQAPARSSGRCGASVATTSVIVALVASLGSALVIKKKD